jgi:uncharacterized cupin superfamily protein
MGVVRLHSKVKMEPGDLMDPSTFTSDDQTELFHNFFATEDESITAGIWECAPCFEEVKDFPCYEMMVFLSGSVTVTDESGPQVFKAGDVLFASKGSDFTWNITEPLRKFYMILEERK